MFNSKNRDRQYVKKRKYHMKHKILSLKNLLFLPAILCAKSTYAVCPVCTIFAGAGVGLSRTLGIDDTITGLWLGGLTVSLIAWTINFLTQHNIKFIGRKPLVAAAYISATLWPLYHYNFIGNPQNTLWGFDKLILGFIMGIIIFTGGCIWYNSIKQKNNGHAQFPLQKVAIPIGLLIIASIIFYSITR